MLHHHNPEKFAELEPGSPLSDSGADSHPLESAPELPIHAHPEFLASRVFDEGATGQRGWWIDLHMEELQCPRRLSFVPDSDVESVECDLVSEQRWEQ